MEKDIEIIKQTGEDLVEFSSEDLIALYNNINDFIAYLDSSVVVDDKNGEDEDE